ncbi:MAG: hypothetical protein WCT77_07730 [Bacteroidota bacterium]
MTITIKNAEYLGNYKIKLFFSDNQDKIIDFGEFLKNAKNTMT